MRVRLAGVCRTDLEICRGLPRLSRHARARVRGRGGRVARPRAARCARRRRDQLRLRSLRRLPRRASARHCPTRRVHGHRRRRRRVRRALARPGRRTCIAVPDGVPDDAAVFAEPLAAAFEILEQLGDVAGTRALVLGDGKLGLLVAQVLTAAGARVIARRAVTPASSPSARAASGSTLGPPDRPGPTSSSTRPGIAGGLRAGARADAPARHGGAEDDRRGRASPRPGAGGGQRGHARRLALRAVRAGARGARRGASSRSRR